MEFILLYNDQKRKTQTCCAGYLFEDCASLGTFQVTTLLFVCTPSFCPKLTCRQFLPNAFQGIHMLQAEIIVRTFAELRVSRGDDI